MADIDVREQPEWTLDDHFALAIRTRVRVETGVWLNDEQTTSFVELIKSVIAAQERVVVPAEDLRTELEHNKPVPMTVNYVAEAHARLHAALPATEETREDEQR